MAVSKRTRFEVLRRDAYTCRYCRSTDNPLTVDHVTPVSLGGSDEPSNLVAACRDCNSGKASSSPDADTVSKVEEDAVRWAAAMRQAAMVMAEQVDDRDAYWGEFLNAWPSHRYMSNNMESTVLRFFDLGLPVNVMAEAARAAGANRGVWDREAYFAAICWKRVKAMQEIAEGIVRAGGDDGA